MGEARYHIYAVKAKHGRPAPQDGPRLIASTDQDGIGIALITLAREGELDGVSVGVLDRPDGEEVGTWIINPYGENSGSLSKRMKTRSRDAAGERSRR